MRVVTSVLVVGLCLFAMSRGWTVIGLAHALTGGADTLVTSDWMGEPTVATSAIDAAVGEMGSAAGIEEASHHADRLTWLLTERPLSSTAWLALASMRLVTAAPYRDVLAALKMSSITGANEERVMWQRGMFGLMQWEALPPDARQRTIADLSGIMIYGEFRDDQVDAAERVLAAKAPEFRAQIATMLTDAGVQPKALRRIGLSAEALQ